MSQLTISRHRHHETKQVAVPLPSDNSFLVRKLIPTSVFLKENEEVDVSCKLLIFIGFVLLVQGSLAIA